MKTHTDRTPGSPAKAMALVCGAFLLSITACSTTPKTPTATAQSTSQLPAEPDSEPGMPAAAMPSVEAAQQQYKGGDTLYEALGGQTGVELLADNFVIELAADDHIRHRFEKSDIGRFHRLIQLQICEVSDGPCVYPGDSMKRTHGGMDIQSSEFNAVVEAMMRAMDNVGVKPGTQNRLLAVLAPMRADIVGQ